MSLDIRSAGTANEVAPLSEADDPSGYVSLAGITVSYGGLEVLHGIDLEIAKGEVVGLLGPSGSGKTTILNVIAGFVAPTAGRVRLDGGDITTVKASSRRLGVMFQGYALFPHMTVAENIAFGLRQQKVPREEIARQVDEMLEVIEMTGRGGERPRALSGGERQRVALARCLVLDPKLMLLDEPLSNLDARLRQRMRFEIRDILRRRGITSIVITHDQDEAFSLCDKVALLHLGRIEQCAAPASLVESPSTPFVADFVGYTNVFDAQVVRAHAASGLVTIGTPNGFTVEVASSTLGPGDHVQVYARPECIACHEASSDLGHEQAGGRFVVRDVVFLGDRHEIWLDGPVGLRARIPLGEKLFPRGAEVGVTFRENGLRAYRQDASAGSGA
jgi:putative spermidine/putrescine transport system ATP-binding protein